MRDYQVGRLGMIQSFMYRAARLVTDSGMHAKGWSREQSIRFFMENVGLDELSSTSEIERYVVWPGQACSYKIGHNEIVRLREAARRQLGDRFDLKGFHDAVLRTATCRWRCWRLSSPTGREAGSPERNSIKKVVELTRTGLLSAQGRWIFRTQLGGCNAFEENVGACRRFGAQREQRRRRADGAAAEPRQCAGSRAGAADRASALDGRNGFGIYIIGAIVLGLIVWGIIELTKGDEARPARKARCIADTEAPRFAGAFFFGDAAKLLNNYAVDCI